MPYCRRCGTQLEENAKFCHRCGLPVAGYIPPPSPTPAPAYQYYPPPQPAPVVSEPKKPLSNRIIFLTVGLIAILIVASVAAALLFVPTTPWGYEKTLSDKTPNVDTLNLNFATNVGDISIITLQVGSGAVLIHVQGNGSYSYLTKTEQPMTSTFDNQTVGNTLTVNSQVTVENAYTSGAAVTIQIYVDPSVKLNLNVTSITGKVSMTADRNTFQSLFLQSTTGSVEANLQDTVTLTGPVSLKTTTGAVNFRMHEIDVVGNSSLNLQTTTGDIGMDITETTQIHGNVVLDAHTTTGTIYLGLEVDSGVGAKIISIANLGQIRTDLTNFIGNKSPLTSSNYPSASNIEITNTVGTGDVDITAKCQTTTIAS